MLLRLNMQKYFNLFFTIDSDQLDNAESEYDNELNNRVP